MILFILSSYETSNRFSSVIHVGKSITCLHSHLVGNITFWWFNVAIFMDIINYYSQNNVMQEVYNLITHLNATIITSYIFSRNKKVR